MMAKTKWIFGGQAPSQPPQDSKPPPVPVASSADAKKFGLENFGNTCYANSVIQALYFCTPFRDLIIQTTDPSIPRESPLPAQDVSPRSHSALPLIPNRRKPELKASPPGNPLDTPPATLPPLHPIPPSPPTLFSALRSLFLHIATNPGDKGVVAPKAFIDKLKESKEDFRSTMHQDAHEFLNHLLNMIVEELEEEKKSAQNNTQGEDLSSSLATLASKVPPTIVTATTSSNSGTSPQDATLVHKLFEGVLTSETRCLTCETVSSRDESFLDLSIDIEQNSSVTACLRSFSASEMLCQRNKFFCDACCDLQEAEKRMKIKKLPNVLALHLKRFKFQEDVQKYIKLTYRVAFPFELRLFNTVDDLENADRLYNLFAIVVHIGSGPNHGHYISIVKSAGSWLVFDDDNVYPIPEGDIPKYYGDSNSGSAYVLYYQAADIDPVPLGLKLSPPAPLLLPEHHSHPIDAHHWTPSQHSQATPSLPPGLTEIESADATNTVIVTPPSSVPLVSPTQTNDKPDHDHSSLLNGSSSVPPGATSPLSPNPGPRVLRRITSISIRPSTATSSRGDKSDRSTHSDFTRSPRHSASSPTLAVPEDSSTVPPVPPLPPPTTSTPTVTAQAQLNGKEKEKEEKEKDKSRKETKIGVAWFKRRSFRLGDKSRSDKTEKALDDLPPSPALKDERPQSGGWFKAASQPRRQPSQVGPFDTAQKTDNGLSAKLEPPQPLSIAPSNASSSVTQQDSFSSSGPSIVLSSPPTTVSSSPPPLPPKPSTPSSKSSRPPQPNDQIDLLPLRKSSLAPSPRSRRSMDQHHKNGTRSNSSPTSPRPSTAAGAVTVPNGLRQLPPIPPQIPTPQAGDSPSPIINGIGPLISEPESIYPLSTNGHGHDVGMDLNTSQTELHSYPMSGSISSLHALHPPPSSSALNNSASGTDANGGGSSTPFRRTKRKLSLTAPILGLGRKEKEKEKEKEKGGRKEKVSPSSFMQRFDPRV